MLRFLRVGSGPSMVLGFTLAVALLSGLGELAIARGVIEEWFVFERTGHVRAAATILGAALYGVTRVFANHPAWNRRHLEWLLCSPWSPGRPLPFGPVAVAPGDGVALALLAAASLGAAPMAPATVLAAAAAAYYLSLSIVLAATGGTAYAAVLVMGGAVALRLGAPRPELSPLLAVLLYPAAWLGIRATFARFPWRGEGPLGRPLALPLASMVSPYLLTAPQRAELMRGATPGWPHGALAPLAGPLRVPPLNRALLAVTVGVVISCVGDLFPPGDRVAIYAVSWFILGLALIHRLTLYVSAGMPPISVTGRLATGRPIIPGYDIIWLAPAGALTARVVLRNFGDAAGIPDAASLGLSLAAALLILALAGPDLQRWRLTAPARVSNSFPANESVTTG